MSWQEIRDRAQNTAFNFYKEPHRIVVGSDTLDPIDAVLDTTQSKIRIPNTDGSYTITALLFVWGRDFGESPRIDEVIEVNGQKYLAKFCDNTTDLLEIHLEAAGF